MNARHENATHGVVERLPPLNALRAFEAAARLLSISLAADELNVTPSAISRQIRQLEEFLRIELFVRGHRQISLTPEGSEYFKAVFGAVGIVRDATRKLTKRAQRKQLKIRTYTTFAMRWLIPRLSGFHLAHPDIEVLLTATLEDVDFRKDPLDGAIRMGDGNWPGTCCYRLTSTILAPVVSPALLRRGPPLSKPSDLRRLTLLHSVARPDDWRCWLEAQSISGLVDTHTGMTYQSSAMAYAAAAEGQGVAIAQLFLVEKDLREGKLITPFRQTVDLGNHTYYLITPSHRPESPDMTTFREWMLGQFDQAARRERVATV
jgi:LysR family transcriptional regulator, glycine cleavage system transcriptional activator